MTSERMLGRRPAGGRIWLAFATIAAFAVAVRIPFLDKKTPDYDGWIAGWIGHLEREGFGAFGDKFSDYAPSYLYLLWLTTFSPLSNLLTVKLISIGFEFALAAGCAFVVLSLTGNWWRALAAFAAVILLPTVVLNGAAWGQSDAVYAAFSLFALGWAVRGKGALAMLFAGAGIAVKAQGLLILPFLLLLTLRGKIGWKSWAWLPVPYVLAVVPPVLLGRGLKESLLIYYDQADAYHKLTLSAPSVYAWLDLPYSVGTPGTYVAAAIVYGAVLAAARWAKLNTPAELLAVATFLLVLAPFVLPKMHDRYFFLADVTAAVYAVLRPRRWFVPVLIVAASLSQYLNYLFDIEPFPLEVAAALMAAALLAITLDVFPGVGAFARRRWAAIDWLRLVRFSSIGAICTVLFVAFYAFFRQELGPLQANALALAITTVFNFLANRAWTFRASRTSIRREAPRYLAIYLLGLVFATVALRVALEFVEDPSAPLETFLALAAGGAGTVTRYALLALLVYAPLPTAHSTPETAEL